MTTPARKRLMRDFRAIQTDPPDGCNALPNAQNIMEWEAVIFGPSLTIWDGSVHRLKLTFTEEYPNKPPTVVFVSKVFHPNVYDNGSICLDILQKAWSAIYDIRAILTSIQSLLPDPNPDSPANAEAAKLYTDDRAEYNRRVMEVVEAGWRWDPKLDGDVNVSLDER